MDTIYWIETWKSPPQLRSTPVVKVTKTLVITDRNSPNCGTHHKRADVRFTPEDAWAKYVGECANALLVTEAAVERLKADLVAALAGRDAMEKGVTE